MRLRIRLAVIVCVFAPILPAQMTPGYLGPGVLSRGSGNIGSRSGQQLNLRFFADVQAVYDNGIQPFSLNSQGSLVEVKGLYGIEGDLGVYGAHQSRKWILGLDYRGNYAHYNTSSFYDGSSHNLTLGYTYQKSRRLIFDLRLLAGTSSRAIGSPGFFGSTVAPSDFVNQPTTLLFDNRIYYLQSSMDVNYLLSPRTIFTFGGDGYTVQRQAKGLASVNGYDLHGSITHRISRTKSIGVSYDHMHFDFPPAFGEADINMGQGFFTTSLGRRWTFSLYGGAYITQVQGLQQVALDPVIAALLGQGTAIQAFYKESVFPTGSVALRANFRTSNVTLSYSRSVTPGNGVYLTSRVESADLSYSYTGLRKWNFQVNGGYNTLNTVGQGLEPYAQYAGGAGITYGLTRSLHVIARYDARQQSIDQYFYRRTSYRATLGLAYSPGDKPLSLW